MQLSDGQLEIYALLKERARLEADTSMSGEEKQAALDSVEARIDDLQEKYGVNTAKTTGDSAAGDVPATTGTAGTYGTDGAYDTDSTEMPALPTDILSAGTSTESGAQTSAGADTEFQDRATDSGTTARG